MSRAVDLLEGRVYVVTDLHGEWDAYRRYRDHFLTLHHRGEADYLLLLGDLIHSDDSAPEDHSVPMVLDVIGLQRELGQERVFMLLGNHELPHIYGIAISKGDQTFTPRFEHALLEHRDTVISFFHSLPFLVRTGGGVMLSHAGAAMTTAKKESAEFLLNFSHAGMLSEAEDLITREDVQGLMQAYGQQMGGSYDQLAWEKLAVTGPEDPRYGYLLRGFIASSMEPEFTTLWDYFFTMCENQYRGMYGKIVERFLAAFSTEDISLSTLVTGHIVVKGGHEVVGGGQQLRLASWTHARPNKKGEYLLFDVADSFSDAAKLADYCQRMP